MNKVVFTYFVKEAAKQQKKKQMTTRDAALTGAGVGLGLSGAFTDELVNKAFINDLTNYNPIVSGTVGEDAAAYSRVSPTMAKEMKKHNIGVADKSFIPMGPHALQGSYVYSPKGSHEAVMAHEMGHVTGLGTNKTYRTIQNTLSGLGSNVRDMRNLGAIAAVPGVALANHNTNVSNEEAAENMRKTRNIALASSLTDAPQLFEEARASARALRHGKFKKGKLNAARVLAPAFGSYFANTVPALSAAGGAEILRRNYNRKAALNKKK